MTQTINPFLLYTDIESNEQHPIGGQVFKIFCEWDRLKTDECRARERNRKKKRMAYLKAWLAEKEKKAETNPKVRKELDRAMNVAMKRRQERMKYYDPKTRKFSRDMPADLATVHCEDGPRSIFALWRNRDVLED